MPKMKTHSGAKKRFKTTAKGRVKFKPSHMRHMQQNKPKSMKRKARFLDFLCAADARHILRNFLPYGRKTKTNAAQKAENKAQKTAKGGSK